jgi:hypothetical protein
MIGNTSSGSAKDATRVANIPQRGIHEPVIVTGFSKQRACIAAMYNATNEEEKAQYIFIEGPNGLAD